MGCLLALLGSPVETVRFGAAAVLSALSASGEGRSLLANATCLQPLFEALAGLAHAALSEIIAMLDDSEEEVGAPSSRVWAKP